MCQCYTIPSEIPQMNLTENIPIFLNDLPKTMDKCNHTTTETSTSVTSIQTETYPQSQFRQQDQNGLIAALVIISLVLVALVIAISLYFIRKRRLYPASELPFDTNYNDVSHQSVRRDSEYSKARSCASQSSKSFHKEDSTPNVYQSLGKDSFKHPKEEITLKEKTNYHEIQVGVISDTDDYNHLGTGDNSEDLTQKHPDNYNHVSIIMEDPRGYNIIGSDVSHAQFRNDYDHTDLVFIENRDEDESGRHNQDVEINDIALRKSKPNRVNGFKIDEMPNTTETGYYNIDNEFCANDKQEQEHGVEVASLFVREQQEVDTLHQVDRAHGVEGEVIYENDDVHNEETASIYELAESI